MDPAVSLPITASYKSSLFLKHLLCTNSRGYPALPSLVVRTGLALDPCHTEPHVSQSGARHRNNTSIRLLNKQ